MPDAKQLSPYSGERSGVTDDRCQQHVPEGAIMTKPVLTFDAAAQLGVHEYPTLLLTVNAVTRRLGGPVTQARAAHQAVRLSPRRGRLTPRTAP